MAFERSRPVEYTTADRRANVNYVNDAGKTIYVSTAWNSAGGSVDLYIDDVFAMRLAAIHMGGDHKLFTFLVPPGAKYRVASGNPLAHWAELR